MSPARRDINKYIIPDFARSLRPGNKVLFVGVNRQYDYRTYFPDNHYQTMDIESKLRPDIIGDIMDCPQIPDETYDAILLIGMWEYMPNRTKMFNEVYRILKNGGKLLFCPPGKAYYRESSKYFDLERDLHSLVGFQIDKIKFTYYKSTDPYYFHIFMRK